MKIKAIQKLTDKEYVSNLTDYEYKVKLFERLDKKLKASTVSINILLSLDMPHGIMMPIKIVNKSNFNLIIW